MKLDKKKFANFVKGRMFIFSKTYAKTAPHKYIVRQKPNKKEQTIFNKIPAFIRENGYSGKYGKTTYYYYDWRGYKYWVIMNILNREKIKNKKNAK